MISPATSRVIANIHPKWKAILSSPSKRDADKLIIDYLDEAVNSVMSLNGNICPNSADKVLRCLQQDPDNIRVVIIGQDPYPQPGVATGLAFAVNDETKYPPSLNILLRELQKEYPEFMIEDGFDSTLQSWEKQGVLLLNSSLSCEEYKPNSHFQYWVEFVEELISVLNDFKITRSEMSSLVFVFLGAQARLFQNEVDESWHYKIYRYHPAAETHGSNKFVGFYKEVNNCLENDIQWHTRIS